MREDIENGRIDTVIVKDQSRFGRSYIEVGMYVEEFKDKGVRFIAVDDGYDSMKSDYDMMFPMRNVINEDSALRKIPESRYEQMSEKYEPEQKELSQGIPADRNILPLHRQAQTAD